MSRLTATRIARLSGALPEPFAWFFHLEEACVASLVFHLEEATAMCWISHLDEAIVEG